jgi:hypothetical protein
MAVKSNDPIGSLFRRKLVEMYGDRLDKVPLAVGGRLMHNETMLDKHSSYTDFDNLLWKN